jgi:hypothetical protein
MNSKTIRRIESLAEKLNISSDDAWTLRRCSMTLHRWSELECGDGNNFASWCINRDASTGVPYMETHPHAGQMRRVRVADRERGALKRIATICAANGLHYYHQTDPRGASLYVARETMTASSYSSIGFAIYR